MRLASREQTLHASVSLKGGERKREEDVVCGIGALQRRAHPRSQKLWKDIKDSYKEED